MFGVEGSNICVYYKDHAWDGVVDVVGELCAQEGGSRQPAFGVEGRNICVYSKHHVG